MLQIITLSEMGGAQRHVFDLIRTLRPRVHMTLVVGAHGWLEEQVRAIGVDCHVLPNLARSVNPWRDLQALTQLVRLIRESEPDLVHLHSSKAGLLGRIAARIVGVPAVFTAHGWGFKPGVPLRRRYAVFVAEALAARLAARIICVSSYDFKLAAQSRFFPRHRLVAIQNGVADNAPMRRPRGDGACRFVMVARFQEPKLQRLLLSAFARLNAPDTQLWFFGAGPAFDAVQAHASGMARVTFWGNQDNARDRLAECDVLVLLSAYEGLPLSIIEAMQVGLPVVASRVGGVPELVVHGSNGLLVDNEDEDAVVTALRELAMSAERREAMGEAGRARYLKQFSLASMAERVHHQYADICARS
ncbi:MAG TPA: glycosyltransferase family 4 protein [Candidatus Aquabacterium excrementipullorum]|nr:glycosyltransferase family 4 protein [Candidatus Aquabacterium excrementipullorum]